MQKNVTEFLGQTMNLWQKFKYAITLSWVFFSVLPSFASEWDEAPQAPKSQAKPFNLNASMEQERLRISREKAAKNSNHTEDTQPNLQNLQPPLNPVLPQTAPLSSAVHAEDFLSTTPLRGAVEKQPSAIPMGLMPGRRFDPRLLPPEGTEDGWYWIPEWSAGIFHRDFQTTLGPTVRVGFSTMNLSRTTEDHVTDNEPSGWQMDKNGGIWDYFHLPRTERHEGSDFIEYKIIRKYQPIEMSISQCVSRIFAQTIRVNKFNGIIQMVYQQDEINKSRPTALGFRQDSLCYWFDENGRPGTSLNRKPSDIITGESKRIRPFSPVNVWKGKDMKASFRLFLLSHGKADLVPEDVPNNEAFNPNIQRPSSFPLAPNRSVARDAAFKLLSEPRSFGKIKLASGETVDCQISGDASNLYYKLALTGNTDFLQAFQSTSELTFELYNEQAFCLGRVKTPMYWKTVVDSEGKLTEIHSSAGVPWNGPEHSKIALWAIMVKP